MVLYGPYNATSKFLRSPLYVVVRDAESYYHWLYHLDRQASSQPSGALADVLAYLLH